MLASLIAACGSSSEPTAPAEEAPAEEAPAEDTAAEEPAAEEPPAEEAPAEETKAEAPAAEAPEEETKADACQRPCIQRQGFIADVDVIEKVKAVDGSKQGAADAKQVPRQHPQAAQYFYQ